MNKAIRVLVAKPGLDGHDRGAKVVARALREAGFEVIYTGLRQTPAQIAAAAVSEDVDCVAMSILSGAHMDLVPLVKKELEERKAGDMIMVVGGIIPEKDIPGLKAMGVWDVFTPGMPTELTAESIKKAVEARDAKA